MERLYPFTQEDDSSVAERQEIVRRHNEKNIMILVDEFMFFEPCLFPWLNEEKKEDESVKAENK